MAHETQARLYSQAREKETTNVRIPPPRVYRIGLAQRRGRTPVSARSRDQDPHLPSRSKDAPRLAGAGGYSAVESSSQKVLLRGLFRRR